MGYARPHLHAGAFAAECQARTNAQEATYEFHGNEASRRRLEFFLQHSFDVRNPAPRCVRGETANQPCGNARRESTGGSDEQEARNTPVVRPGDQIVSKSVGPLKGEAKDCSYQTRARPGDECRECEQKQAALALSGLCGGFRLTTHA
jgi:hypothetical protein